MRKFKINSTEIIDCTNEDESGNILLSGISVLVNFTIETKTFMLDFQTTETFDYSAISSNLASSDLAGVDHSSFIDFIGDDDKSEALLELIKTESNAQEIWNDYVYENFIINEDHFNGMDANSEINTAVRR
jgi:hypothetical protein